MPTKPRIAIIAADFNKDLIDTMIGAATDELASQGLKPSAVIRVPGCYEVPLAAELHLDRADTDALIVLGYIERGDTMHGEVMGHVVHTAIIELQIDHAKPIAIGIIGPGATSEQAEARKSLYAQSAAKAVLRMLTVVADASKPARPSARSRK